MEVRRLSPRSVRRSLAVKLFALGLSLAGLAAASAQPVVPPPVPVDPSQFTAPSQTLPAAGDCVTACEPAPCWAISNVPNFMGGFFGRGARACRTVPGQNNVVTRTLTYTGNSGDNFGVSDNVATFFPLGSFDGPGGPFPWTRPVTGVATINDEFILNESTELTGSVARAFPGATYVGGIGDFSGQVAFDYRLVTGMMTPDQVFCVNLPNPSGGGLAGRNRYFENGSPTPQDRVYFFYNHIGNFNALGRDFDINRYVLGVEKTALDGRVSLEVRLPFAGTANSVQTANGGGIAVDHAEFGNVGLVGRVAVYRTSSLLVSAGLGLSFATADDSEMLLNGQTDVAIENRATILSPIAGIVWAPNDRFYSQLGVQFDFDPTGNPVQARDVNNALARAGVLRDQAYCFVSAAAGYWVYQSEGTVRGIALQTELHYDAAFGSQDSVSAGNVVVADLNNRFDILSTNAGVVVNLGDRATITTGVNVPLTGDNLYDWGLVAAVNFRFGPR